MNEQILKAQLVKVIRKKIRGAVVFRHEDMFTAGIPDISVTHGGMTAWIEVKFVNKQKDNRLRIKKLQKFTCQNLDDNGFCRILVYELDPGYINKTYWVEPAKIDFWRTSSRVVQDFNHEFVVEMLRSRI